MIHLRPLVAALLLALALPAGAQTPARPSNLQPVPAPPPPPPGYELDPRFEPEVVIRQQGADKVEEYRVGGKLYMIRVTPAHGTPYYMVDRIGDGKLVKDDNAGSNIRPPMWVIFSF